MLLGFVLMDPNHELCIKVGPGSPSGKVHFWGSYWCIPQLACSRYFQPRSLVGISDAAFVATCYHCVVFALAACEYGSSR